MKNSKVNLFNLFNFIFQAKLKRMDIDICRVCLCRFSVDTIFNDNYSFVDKGISINELLYYNHFIDITPSHDAIVTKKINRYRL